MSGLVDTHAHLMDPAFDVDRDAVCERARQAGVVALILVGYDLASSHAAIELTRQIPATAAAVGIHPNSVSDANASDFDAIARLARAPEVVGIGETGLDYYRHHTPPDRQREAFDWHLSLAEELKKPVIVHNRQADADVATLVHAHDAVGVLHCFSSTDPNYLERMLDAGFFVSFAGPLTFKNAAPSRSIAARVPHDRLLVETDCPYLAPEPHRGRRNEPAFVRETAMCLANILGLSLESFVDMLWQNSVSVFPTLRRVASEAIA
jgi:TatD DNase family protein